MVYKLSHVPLVKILLPFIAGILVFNTLTVSFYTLSIISISLFVLFLFSHLSNSHPYVAKLNFILSVLLIFTLGGWWISSTKKINTKNYFSNYDAKFTKGIILNPIEEKENTYKTVLNISQIIDSNGNKHYTNGKLLAYIKKDSNFNTLEIGDEILFTLNATPIAPPKNPAQFDYANYLSYKSIYYQTYIPLGGWVLNQKHKAYFILRISDNIGNYVQNILRKYIPGKAHFSLADGILLGHRADIDIELYNAFAYTGILHILSVSGLHVGIIYGMLLFFLGFIPDKNRKVKIGKFIFIFCFIWIFTFVTGFSAACVRAAILFSLLNFGKLSREHVNNINLLAGAALIQLLINPNNLFDIGFQLSYLAMLGLFIFTLPIYSLFFSKYKIIDWLWKLWAASIAAQLFTVPISIYYFGNFPTYFLFANIFAIPLSAVILWVSMLLIPFSFIPILAHFIGILDAWCVELFIQFTYFFSNLPFGKLYNLTLTPIQLVILMFAISLLALSIIKQKGYYILACLGLFIVAILLSIQNNINQLKQTELVLYSVPNNFTLGVNTHNYQYLLSSDSVSKKSLTYSVVNSHRKYFIDKLNFNLLNATSNHKNIFIKNDLLMVGNKSFYFFKKDNSKKIFETPLAIDYLILCNNCFLNIEQVKSNFNFNKILISTDNNQAHQKIYRKILQENKINFIDLNEKYLELIL